MRISVFGLGYVGVVTATCLAKRGCMVIGTDVDATKVELVNNGQSPIVENKVSDLLLEVVQQGRLVAAIDPDWAVAESDLCLICVGTPSRENGSLDASYVERVCRHIGRALRDRPDLYTVVVRSTVLPGTSRNVLLPVLEEVSHKRAGVGFGYCFNPEFLREGTAVDDFFHPPKTVIGGSDPVSIGRLRSLYDRLPASLIETSIEIAEIVKYTDNVWHALKVAFANEIGTLCKAQHLDSHEVMDIFCRDTKLNISPAYLKPGLAFGGSCLPKDLRALVHKARQLDLDLPILSAVLPSNELQLDRAIRMVQQRGKRKVGILGLTFKPGTDDLRESPMVRIVERLLGKGYELRVFDGNLSVARLRGANLEYLRRHISHISRLLADTPGEVIDFAEVVVIGKDENEYHDLIAHVPTSKVVLDFARAINPVSAQNEYHGICW
jgi:GDP-mannose 6-dehydrogenase